ncbi:uncharacterized protein LOC114859332 [Betta splendens]|uniref:Uncharacterized protein LOC114859332 n=1 Tax=Betta splendens TaxID=158456 RepID=A0A6P7N1B9_BETSP|nr:uncharacterized protein LOC114859332 [Betta splendens]
MKMASPEERLEEIKKAKESTKVWTRNGRNWDYKKLCEYFPHKACRWTLVRLLRENDFYVDNAPLSDDMENDDDGEVPTTSGLSSSVNARGTSEGPAESATMPNDVPATTGSGSEREEEDDSSDLTWQNSAFHDYKGVRCIMQEMGLYEKFPTENATLQAFKQQLIEKFEYLNCQQEVDNVSRMLRFMQPKGEDIDYGFLTKSTETQDFIMSLKKATLKPATILNYRIFRTIRRT